MQAETYPYNQQVRFSFSNTEDSGANRPAEGRFHTIGRVFKRLVAGVGLLRKVMFDLTAVVLPFLAVALFVSILTDEAVTINQPSVPQAVQERGITPNLLSQLIKVRLQEIQLGVETGRLSELANEKLNRLVTTPGQEPLAIETAGVSLSLRSLAHMAANLVGMDSKRHFDMDVLCISPACDGEGLLLQAVAQGDRILAAEPVSLEAAHLTAAVDAAAKHLLQRFDPMLLARYLYKVEQDIGGAVELASLVIEERPDQAIKAHNLLGVVAMNHGIPGNQSERFQLSAQHLQTALAMDADFVPALINHGLLAGKLDQIDEATQSLERAIALDPTNAMAHSTYGTVLMWACRWDEAVAAYESAITFDPSLPTALLGPHRVEAMQRGDYTGIIGAYHELVKLRPHHASRWVGLQEVLAYEDERRRRHEVCSGSLTTMVANKL